MKDRIKQEKGITMIALVITVVILVILTNVLIYNAKDSLDIKVLTNLYNDISMLREKVSAYYNEYGKIPAEIKYTNTSKLEELENVLSTSNDTGDFYVIDLEAMQGITLNYGKDYEKVKNDIKNGIKNVDNYTDLYIINENSHNIFYVEGIKIEEKDTEKIYYTDYIEPDQTDIDLRYVDGILIPDGCYYIGKTPDGSGNESIVISTNPGEKIDISQTNQYIWTKQVSELEKIPDSVNLVPEENQIEYQFIKSVNTYKGYFKNSDGNVQYVVIDEEKWSEAYRKEMEYEDKNGDKVTIPEGFKVSMSPTMNTVEKGFVVKDSNDNEWVWVVLPHSIFITAENNTDYDNIKADLIEYAKDYREGSKEQGLSWTDEWYDGCGIVAENGKTGAEIYTEMYNKMLSSVYTNGGFWISRYEIGDSTATESNTTRTSSSGTTGTAVSKPSQIPYNYVTCSQAQTLASRMKTDPTKTSSLLFGIQWDLVCKFLQEKGGLSKEEIKGGDSVGSTNWGNYANSPISLVRGKYNTASNSSNSKWVDIIPGIKNKLTLLTTGASEGTNKMNIYDFAGNEWEWTLEKVTSETLKPCAGRGGCYNNPGYSFSVSNRGYNLITYNNNSVGFRATLY